MKNLYILDLYQTTKNGVETYKNELFYCLSKLSDVNINHIILEYPIAEFTTIQVCGVNKIYFPYTRGKVKPEKRFEIASYLLRLYIKDSPDTVFFQNYLPSACIIEAIRKHYIHAKIIYTIHDFLWAYKTLGDTDQYQKIVKEGNNKAVMDSYYDGCKTFSMVDKVVCLSQDTYDLLNKFYDINENKLVHIPNGMRENSESLTDTQKKEIKNRLHLSVNSKLILFVGRVSSGKGAFALLKCFRQVLKEYPESNLVIAGTIDTQFLGNLEEEIKTRIIFLGVIEKEQLFLWYRLADLGVIPSYFEQCSFTGIEMMMHGLPIIASDGFGVKCMFDEHNAVIAKIEDRDKEDQFQNSLSNAIVSLLKSKSLRVEMSKRSRKKYEKYYLIDTMKENYNKLITTI